MDIIENELLIASFSRNGAEITSLKSKKTGREYIFPGIPQFWSKSSPVLFPIVGCVKNGKYTHDNTEYNMHIHGFANYQDFEVLNKTDESIEFILKSEGRFLEIYPFEFELIISYRLVENELIVGYKVINLSEETMYFQIGGHTAFACPIEKNEDRKEYYLMFENLKNLDCSRIDMSCGLLMEEHETIPLSEIKQYSGNGILKIEDGLFDKDALIGENNQTNEIYLLTPDQRPYLSVKFDAPLFGIWSPRDRVMPENIPAPFVCIEPWYGRCDKREFAGELKDREWINTLGYQEEFYREYIVKIFFD